MILHDRHGPAPLKRTLKSLTEGLGQAEIPIPRRLSGEGLITRHNKSNNGGPREQQGTMQASTWMPGKRHGNSSDHAGQDDARYGS